jgi:hypothetical protein
VKGKAALASTSEHVLPQKGVVHHGQVCFKYQDEPKTAGTADVDDARSRITVMTDWSRWFIVSFL